jgi:hypothetical protein
MPHGRPFDFAWDTPSLSSRFDASGSELFFAYLHFTRRRLIIHSNFRHFSVFSFHLIRHPPPASSPARALKTTGGDQPVGAANGFWLILVTDVILKYDKS